MDDVNSNMLDIRLQYFGKASRRPKIGTLQNFLCYKNGK